MVIEESLMTLLEPRAQANFIETPFIRGIVDRGLTYIEAGFPIHFRGSGGTGKTSLAMHLASRLARPVVMIHGDEEFSTSDLVGGEHGYRIHRVIDNYIHSVLKTDEDMSRRWVDYRLTIACRHGFTLIYDEFTRSRPEANNVLLSVLQEKMLDLPAAGDGEGYLRVHPDFTLIFTSNPEEYAGVYRSQDALRDRMVTLDLDHFDEETETAITTAKSELAWADAEKIVRVVRGLRESGLPEVMPTVRSCIKVARVVKIAGCSVAAGDHLFRQFCLDVLASASSRVPSRTEMARLAETVNELVDRHC